MRQWLEEFVIEAEHLESKGVVGPFYIFPTIEKRCFVPCDRGNCNCRSTVDGRYCVIAEKYKAGKIAELNDQMNTMNRLAQKALEEHKKENNV